MENFKQLFQEFMYNLDIMLLVICYNRKPMYEICLLRLPLNIYQRSVMSLKFVAGFGNMPIRMTF